MPVAVNNTAIPDTGPAPLTVTFHGEAGLAATYMYNIIVQFGDATPDFTLAGGPGTTFFDTNHIYAAVGVYSATMIFNTDVDVITPVTTPFTITVTAPPIPVADFIGNPLVGVSPLSVAFTDLSTNSPTSWSWDFGDGSPLGTTQNPTHIYASGTYSVTLTATNAGGSGNLTKTNYIAVTAPIVYKTKIQGGGVVYSSSNPLSPDINFNIKGNLDVTSMINTGSVSLINGQLRTPIDSGIDLTISTNTNGLGGAGNIILAPAAGGNIKLNSGVTETQISLGAGSNFDLNAANYFTKTITGVTAFTASNVPAAGTVSTFILDIINGGSSAITWMANTKWAGGTAPTLTAAGRDVLGFFTYDAGATWSGLVLDKDLK